MKRASLILLMTAWLSAGLLVDAGVAPGAWARARKLHVPKVGAVHRLKTPHIPRARRYTYRSITVRRADGTVLRGYRDNDGTHLRGPDGKLTRCRKSSQGFDGDEIVCR
jgi:hypothetical protein